MELVSTREFQLLAKARIRTKRRKLLFYSDFKNFVCSVFVSMMLYRYAIDYTRIGQETAELFAQWRNAKKSAVGK